MRTLVVIAVVLGVGCDDGKKSGLGGQKSAALSAVKAGDYDAFEPFLASPARLPAACKAAMTDEQSKRLRELTRERIAPCAAIDWGSANVLQERGGEVGDAIRDADIPAGCELIKVSDLELRVAHHDQQWDVKALNDAFLADGKLLMFDPPKCESAVYE